MTGDAPLNIEFFIKADYGFDDEKGHHLRYTSPRSGEPTYYLLFPEDYAEIGYPDAYFNDIVEYGGALLRAFRTEDQHPMDYEIISVNPFFN